MIYTTLNRIREHSPCTDGWRKLLKHLGKTEADDDPLAYSTILESNGLDDVLWCLRVEPQHASIWRMYAVRCARRVQHLMTDERSLQALDVAERYARGLATDEELVAARAAAWAADARADAWDAWDAAEDAIREDFERMLAAHHAMPMESCALVDWWQGEAMTDIIERLRIESRREPHEPIWRDAIDEIEALRAEVERLSRYYKNGVTCFANPCERHSGERTPPFAEFFEKYGGQCLICVVDNNKALQAENERLTECLHRANAQAEHFEREWYLRGEEVDALCAKIEAMEKTTPTGLYVEKLTGIKV